MILIFSHLGRHKYYGRIALNHVQACHLFRGASTDSSEALKSAEKMLELMTSSPQMQQMMMASLPPEARSPEAIKQMLQHPGIKQKLVEMIAQQVHYTDPMPTAYATQKSLLLM
jgi:hypothetical protein